MVHTKSEKLFEAYCKCLSISCERIEEVDQKRPDYRLEKNGLFCIAEVKEFVANKDEKLTIDSMKRNGVGTPYGCPPGQRVRKKISDAIPQLKNLTKGIHPGILVLYYNVPELFGEGCTDAYHVLTAMYGFQTVRVPNGSQIDTPDKFGSGRKISATCNTTLSAIMVIRDFTGEISSSVYHNSFASTPIPFAYFSDKTCNQFILDDASDNEFKPFSQLMGHRWIPQ
jgi:hypothetical protein